MSDPKPSRDRTRKIVGAGLIGLAVVAHCRNQAAFLAQFPDCDHGCEQLVRDHFTRGWR